MVQIPLLQKQKTISKNNGFTLIELLVVIAIIGILSSIVFAAVNTARNRARTTAARSAVREIKKAIDVLALDTGYWPSQEAAAGPISPQQSGLVDCSGSNNEVQDLADSQTGLLQSHAAYPGWRGPYIDSIPLDPWGNNYFFDTDYDIPPTGDGTWGAVVGSYGPNGVGKRQNKASK